MEVGFSLGSNLGDRASFLIQARDQLLAVEGSVLVGQSAIYETAPVGVATEHSELNYLNAVVVLESSLSAREWLPIIGKIEHDLGRVRTGEVNAPREVDVDILFAGDMEVDDADLKIPHPRWAQRRFVVEPLCEIKPDLILPRATGSVQEILSRMKRNDAVNIFKRRW